jgi:PPOX class probable F420-dependent enzyme
MQAIPEQFHDLLKDETKAFLFLATTMKDGSPQVTPIWFNHDETHILINSAKGRLKDKNMRARPRVAFVIQDPANAYRYIQIRGRVVEITEEGADDHIDALMMKYRGQPKYPYRAKGEVRVTYKILPEKIDAH